jgi:selenocysteine-specific elongation factor
VILGTAGHIDHGKTTLVRALTGVDTDRLPEEKRRGITIELGFAPLVLDGVGTIGVVDVPGHEAFVRTMVAGCTGIDLALVVIAADEGIMPQTREHLAILELLGVRRGVVALTKIDLVDDEWLDLVEEDVRQIVSQSLPDAPVVRASAQTGQGIDELRAALATAARSVPARDDDDLFRLPVDRAFTIKGTGTVVTGTVWSGRLERDDSVRVLPNDLTSRVRAIQGHGSQLDAALPGTRAAIALAGVDVADVARGSTIVTDPDWRPTTLARADITFVPGFESVARPRTWYRLHVGTTEVGVRVVTPKVDAHDGAVGARLILDAPVPLRAGDRFVIRTSAPLNTIAGGVVTDPYAAKRARPWPAGLSVEGRLVRLVDEAGSHGLERESLPVRLGLTPRACERLVADETTRPDGKLVALPRSLVARSLMTQLAEMVLVSVEEFHTADPLEIGIPMQAVRSRLHASEDIVDAVVSGLLQENHLVTVGGLLARHGWEPNPSAAQQVLLETIVSNLSAAGAEPPTTDELGATVGADPLPLLRFLERRGGVVQVEPNRYYDATQLTLLLDRIRSAFGSGGELGPGELRDALGLSRKYVIPMLEYCDRRGLTARGAKGRVWRSS